MVFLPDLLMVSPPDLPGTDLEQTREIEVDRPDQIGYFWASLLSHLHPCVVALHELFFGYHLKPDQSAPASAHDGSLLCPLQHVRADFVCGVSKGDRVHPVCLVQWQQ